ncbi:MAG: pyridoxamine 5'-phosphate oxidase family protein [Candidatus Omnitrophica bacterium]|nr:pyridoxamine 5'-phosphate oxidase family protein [Candidatus Omnitrophota bacterium]
MIQLNKDVVHFLQNQGFVVVSTIDAAGYPHNSCKGIVEIDEAGRVFLLDLFHARTRKNLEANPLVSITAVDEHKFIGYCLKGRARVVTQEEVGLHLTRAWEERITSRLSRRLIKNIHGEKGHALHPEALLPKPEYLIEIDVKEVVDLSPHP